MLLIMCDDLVAFLVVYRCYSSRSTRAF